MVNCSFNAVHERDMDILFMESLASDPNFTTLVLSKTKYSGKEFQVLSTALSETEMNLGETDICVILRIEDRRVGLLIEDKVDAIAMPDQHLRYHKRGEAGVLKGKYDAYEVFIFCPQKYYDNNSEAKKYETFLRTSEKSNGWWPNYATRLGDAYIYHKRPEGFVDLTFPNAADKIDFLQSLASWLRSHNVSNVVAVKTGRAAALRIEVPKIPLTAVFEDMETTDIKKCFDAIQALTDFANLIEDTFSISAIKTKRKQ